MLHLLILGDDMLARERIRRVLDADLYFIRHFNAIGVFLFFFDMRRPHQFYAFFLPLSPLLELGKSHLPRKIPLGLRAFFVVVEVALSATEIV